MVTLTFGLILTRTFILTPSPSPNPKVLGADHTHTRIFKANLAALRKRLGFH